MLHAIRFLITFPLGKCFAILLFNLLAAPLSQDRGLTGP